MSAREKYLPFDLEIRPHSEQELEVRLLRSHDHRHAQGPFLLPPGGREQLEKLVTDLTESLRGDAQASDQGKRTPKHQPSPKDIGTQLHEALFSEDLEHALIASLGRIDPPPDEDSPSGLRLRLIFDKELADVASLPWELLYQSRKREYWGRCPLTPISISIAGHAPVAQLRIKPPLRILVVAPKPTGKPDLDLAEELRKLRQALRKLQPVEIEMINPPTLDQLVDVLDKDNHFHILHFMGHGAFNTTTGRGCLSFENPDGSQDLVQSNFLVSQLQAYTSLKLVVLNTCRSAQMPRLRGQDPFTGVATAFVLNGMPAVVAMRFPISDRAAIAFSEKFYTALANGDPVDVAATKGRKAIYLNNRDSLEWITPTLFMQVPNGDLQIRGKVPTKLGIRSLDGHFAGMEERTENINLLDQFDGRAIRAPLSRWRTDIYPRVESFLIQKSTRKKALHLELPAHNSIAFASGYVLSTNTGYEVSLRQRGVGGTHWWHFHDGSANPAVHWGDMPPTTVQKELPDLAVAVNISRSAVAGMKAYIEQESLPIRDTMIADLSVEHGQASIGGGAHAFQLAEKLINSLEEWQQEHGGLIHLFAAAPMSFMFFLGQLSRNLRSGIQLYEFDFDPQNQKPGAYSPSLRFPITDS